MKVSKELIKENAYNKTYVNKNQMDYGGIYSLTYTSPNDTKKYYVFIIHPNLNGKTHCLDLSKIEDYAFKDFFRRIRESNDFRRAQLKIRKKGYVKQNIHIGPRFYETIIKPNNVLMKEQPYRTFIFNKIKNVKYIPYDVD